MHSRARALLVDHLRLCDIVAFIRLEAYDMTVLEENRHFDISYFIMHYELDLDSSPSTQQKLC
jgi:hypothetical protein